MNERVADIEIHVEELVLHGGAGLGNRDALAEQLVAVLEAGVAEDGLGGWATDGARIDHLATAPVGIPSGPQGPGASIGRAIAAALR